MISGGNKNKDRDRLTVALAGPDQPGALGIVQLSGPGARAILNSFFERPLADRPGKIQLGIFRDGEGNPVDQVLVVQLPLEFECFEITAHGGRRILQRILDTLQHAGAELIDASENIADQFRLSDDVAREAYRLLPNVKTTLAVKFLLHQAEQGIPSNTKEALAFWPAVEFLLKGVTVVLAGPPNAGKSTLLNQLSGQDHALVADQPGTTRDYVQAPADLGGVPVTLVDTAGLGATSDPLAPQARQKTFHQIDAADVLFLVLDGADKKASSQFLKEFQAGVVPPRIIVLLNKIDHPGRQFTLDDLNLPSAWPALEISALRQINLEKIPELLGRVLGLEGFDYRQPTLFTPDLVKWYTASMESK